MTVRPSRRRSRALAFAAALPWTLPAGAQTPACELLKEQLGGRFEANGVRGFTLEAVPVDTPVPEGTRVVGNCEAGRYKVLFRRGADGSAPPRAASTAPAATGTAAAPAVPATSKAPPKAAAKAASAPDTAAPADPAEARRRAVERATARLAQAEFRFEVPEAIDLGASATVRLVPAGGAGASWLQAALQSPAGDDAGAPAVPVAVEAQLAGPGARITAPTEAPGAADPVPSQWSWQVQPTTAGRIDLGLTLSARFAGVDGGEAQQVVRRFEQSVAVPVPLTQRAAAWFTGLWGWVAGFAVLALAGMLWAWHAQRSAYDAAGLPRGPKLS